MINYLVSYADTDGAGLLHHARCVGLVEQGYHHWLKRHDLSYRSLSQDHQLSLVVYRMVARYRSHVFLDDEIRLETSLQAVDRKGLEWQSRIIKGDEVAFTMQTKMACRSNAVRSVVSVPAALLARLEAVMQIDAGLRADPEWSCQE